MIAWPIFGEKAAVTSGCLVLSLRSTEVDCRIGCAWPTTYRRSEHCTAEKVSPLGPRALHAGAHNSTTCHFDTSTFIGAFAEQLILVVLHST